MVEAKESQTKVKLAKSKYAMLEIFSFLWTRREAIYELRRINRRFKDYSKDPYLENYGKTKRIERVYICERYSRRVLMYDLIKRVVSRHEVNIPYKF